MTTLKSRVLARNTAPLGSWLMAGSPTVAEALGHCGFDFLVVDMEHSPIDLGETVAMLRALAGTPTEPIVRLAWNDQILVKRVLDAGARTLMFPFVQTAEEAREAVSFTRYPPEGVRGVAVVHRASGYGRKPNFFKTAHEDLTVIIQLETPTALAIGRLTEIAGVPGVDSLFVGPGDLSAAMGHIGNAAHADVQALIARAAKTARALGKPIGIVGSTPEMVRRYLDYGYTWVAVAADISFMTARAMEWIATIKGEKSAPASTTGAAY